MFSDLGTVTRDHFSVANPAARFHKQTGGRSEVLLPAGSAVSRSALDELRPPLPREDEFDAVLHCGILAHGFLRLRCGECGHYKLLAFSCQRRGFCPSRGARRAAHVADRSSPCRLCNPASAGAPMGVGTGAGLGSHGAVTLSRNGRFLFVVNAASNTVSTFAVRPAGLVLKSVVDTGGLTPTSVAENDGPVCVLRRRRQWWRGGLAQPRRHLAAHRDPLPAPQGRCRPTLARHRPRSASATTATCRWSPSATPSA